MLSRSFESLSPEVQSLLVDINVLKDAGFQNASAGRSATRVTVPNSSSFDSVWNAKTLENFIWDMEQYFKAAKVPDGEQVSLVGMYLTANAKLWWMSRHMEDTRVRRSTFNSWEEL